MNDKAWTEIFKDRPEIIDSVHNEGFFDIEAKLIKKYREPRLACYIDDRRKLPKILKENNLSILAIQNGLYRIARTDTFFKFDKSYSPSEELERTFELPDYFQAISPNSITSESKALDAAHLSGMLDYVFRDDDVKLVLRGRERSKNFEFTLRDLANGKPISYNVNQVTIEVDGGYEGRRGIYLVEAKNYEHSHMSLRQMLYPYLHYNMKFGSAKPVKSYFLFCDLASLTYHFYDVKFDVPDTNRTSFTEISQNCIRCRLLRPLESSVDWWEELHRVQIDHNITDLDRPFPQADDFNRILALFRKIPTIGRVARDELFREYAIDPRQFDYYGNALRWLKVADCIKGAHEFELTNSGRLVQSMTHEEQVFELAKIAVSNDVFNNILRSGIVNDNARYRNRLRADTTFHRRVHTAKAWLQYFERVLNPSVLK